MAPSPETPQQTVEPIVVESQQTTPQITSTDQTPTNREAVYAKYYGTESQTPQTPETPYI